MEARLEKEIKELKSQVSKIANQKSTTPQNTQNAQKDKSADGKKGGKGNPKKDKVQEDASEKEVRGILRDAQGQVKVGCLAHIVKDEEEHFTIGSAAKISTQTDYIHSGILEHRI